MTPSMITSWWPISGQRGLENRAGGMTVCTDIPYSMLVTDDLRAMFIGRELGIHAIHNPIMAFYTHIK